MSGGELFVAKIPSMKIIDLAKAIAPECRHETIGIRPGEKLHEIMITEDDACHTMEFEDYYIIEPEFTWWSNESHASNKGKPVKEGFRYTSDTNDRWMTVEDMKKLIQD